MLAGVNPPPAPKQKKAPTKKAASDKQKDASKSRSKLTVDLELSESDEPPSPTSPLHPPEHLTPAKRDPNRQIKTPSKPQAQKFSSPKPFVASHFDWDEIARDQTLGRGKRYKRAPKHFLEDCYE